MVFNKLYAPAYIPKTVIFLRTHPEARLAIYSEDVLKCRELTCLT